MKIPRVFARRFRLPGARPATLQIDEHEYAVRWSARRRTVEIAIDARGALRLAAPMGCDVAFLVAFARRKRAWVTAKLAERAAAGPAPAAPTFDEGGWLPFLGASHPVVVAARRRPAVTFVDGRFEIAREAVAVGREPAGVAVREMGRRWGSCARDGRIGFNWRLVLLAPELVDYVVVHELAHLAEHHHGPAFWRVVEAAQPDYRERRAALRRAAVAIGWSWD
jgi:predicted metal-dependent hydrolase